MYFHHPIWPKSFNFKILVFLVLFSCSGEKAETLEKVGIISIPQNEKLAKSNSKDHITTLAQTIPLTREVLKSWLPDLVGAYKKTKLVAGYKESAEMSAVKASYQNTKDSSKIIFIEILDGAGPTASVLLSGVQQKLNMDYEEFYTNEFSKVHEKKGLRVWEYQNKDLTNSELEYIQAGRYIIKIKGEQVLIDELWIFSQYLELENVIMK